MSDRDNPGGDQTPVDDPARTTPTPERAETPEAPSQLSTPAQRTGSAAEREFTVARRSQTRMIIRRFLRHRAAVVSLVVFVAVLLFAFLGQEIWHYSYVERTPDESMPPSWKHPFGTTSDGKDELALVMRGTQRSLQIAILVAAVSGVFGTIWGAVAGFYRGWTDALMMRFSDLILTFPVIAIGGVLSYQVGGGSWWLVGVIIASLQWAYVSRVVRGVTLSLREKEFVEAARALGARDSRIIFRHIVPNALGPIIVNVTILIAVAILVETALSYLGLGVQPPDTSLGLLVDQAQTAVATRPWLFYFPGLFIILIALTINFIGDGLRDAFDPQQGKVRK